MPILTPQQYIARRQAYNTQPQIQQSIFCQRLMSLSMRVLGSIPESLMRTESQFEGLNALCRKSSVTMYRLRQ